MDMGVIIITNELSEEKVRQIQEEVNSLQNECGYTLRSIIHYLGLKKKLSVKSLYLNLDSRNGKSEVTLDVRKIPK